MTRNLLPCSVVRGLTALMLLSLMTVAQPGPAGSVPVMSSQQLFSTPEEAARTLVAAVRADDVRALRRIFGPGGDDIIASGDPVDDARARIDFLKHVAQRCDLVKTSPKSFMLRIGSDRWPFAVPIVSNGQGWRFDTAVGRQEVRNRRVGRNELATVDTLHEIVEAQNEYRRSVRPGEYATRVVSTPGTHDGLYWPPVRGAPPSPIGPLMAKAVAEGYRAGSGQPFHGYRYRILTEQGPHAPGGARPYAVNARMTRGFAVVAWPAKWGTSGVTTFMVDQHGIVYQKNLGPSTTAAVEAITRFDPDPSWAPVPAMATGE